MVRPGTKIRFSRRTPLERLVGPWLPCPLICEQHSHLAAFGLARREGASRVAEKHLKHRVSYPVFSCFCLLVRANSSEMLLPGRRLRRLREARGRARRCC